MNRPADIYCEDDWVFDPQCDDKLLLKADGRHPISFIFLGALERRRRVALLERVEVCLRGAAHAVFEKYQFQFFEDIEPGHIPIYCSCGPFRTIDKKKRRWEEVYDEVITRDSKNSELMIVISFGDFPDEKTDGLLKHECFQKEIAWMVYEEIKDICSPDEIRLSWLDEMTTDDIVRVPVSETELSAFAASL